MVWYFFKYCVSFFLRSFLPHNACKREEKEIQTNKGKKEWKRIVKKRKEYENKGEEKKQTKKEIDMEGETGTEKFALLWTVLRDCLAAAIFTIYKHEFHYEVFLRSPTENVDCVT
jgi:hypothetical protein